MFRILIAVGVVTMVTGAWAADFTDDFTDDAFTQENWTFYSPLECLNNIAPTQFDAEATAANGELCVSAPFPGIAVDIELTLGFGVVNQEYTGDVAVYAGVHFTEEELNNSADNENVRVVKGVMLRFDPRQAPVLAQFGCPASPDGTDGYYVNMDPESGGVFEDGPTKSGRGANDFSIRTMIDGLDAGPPPAEWDGVLSCDEDGDTSDCVVWAPGVTRNVIFSAVWDEALQTNHLQAVLYGDDLKKPLIILEADDDRLRPDDTTLNTGNKYVGFYAVDDKGAPVIGNCLQTNSLIPKEPGLDAFAVRETVINFSPEQDDDQDGVPDFLDDGCPMVPADVDRDGDVDADDVNAFFACVTGPMVPLAPGDVARCGVFDFDQDNDVDHTNYALVQRCMSGENSPAAPACVGG